MYTSILVPLDGSQRAEKILPHAIQLAMRFGAEVILLKVDEPELMLGRDEVVDADRYLAHRQRCQAESETYLATVRQKLEQEGIGVRTSIAYGLPVNAILETARKQNISLVAMASHGLNALPQQYYGSTAAGVLQRIDRPLLLIRSQAA